MWKPLTRARMSLTVLVRVFMQRQAKFPQMITPRAGLFGRLMWGGGTRHIIAPKSAAGLCFVFLVPF